MSKRFGKKRAPGGKCLAAAGPTPPGTGNPVTSPKTESMQTARSSIRRKDQRYYDYLAQTGQLEGNADKTLPFVQGLAWAIEKGDV